MRAFQLVDYSGPSGLQLVETADPVPGPDELLVEVQAIGVNFPDLLMTKGLYQNRPELPTVPGCEIAGVVIKAPRHGNVQAGERVSGFVWAGGFAERAVLPLHSTVRLADSVDVEDAAAMMVNYHTAHFALVRRGRVRAGDTVLVMGAGGGIGTAAVQVALGLGAKVIAGVSADSRVAIAKAAGASDVIVLQPGFSKELRTRTGGRGVDVVVDPLGDWLFDEALRGLAPEGRMLVIGFAAGQIPQVKLNRLLLRNASVVGVAFGAILESAPDLVSEQATSLNDMASAGFVHPQIGARFRFEQLPDALTQLDAGRIPGKGIVVVRDLLPD